MTIHPRIAEVLATLSPPPDGALDPAAMRAGEQAQVPPSEQRLPLHAVDDQVADGVPVRVYLAGEGAVPGAIVYIHGGAFFLGSLDTHDHVAREIAAATGFAVVSVGYRLAPEHHFPAGLEDCYAAVKWAAQQPWGGDRLVVAGDSSGAGMAAAVTAMARDEGFDRITDQVLYYPSVDLDFDEDRYPSLRDNAVGYGLETQGLKPFNAFYVDSGADPADPLVSPIKRQDLSGLPRALIVTAEYDPLRDEGELYGARLAEAGVEAKVSRYAGANHGFVANFSWIPEFHRVFDETAEFLGRT